jgi:hypothetical protein
VLDDENSLEEYSEVDEREIYDVGTRSGRKYTPYKKNKRVDSESRKEQELLGQIWQSTQIRDTKTRRNEGLNKDRKKKILMNKCNWYGETGHFGTECPQILKYAICIKCKQRGHEWNKCPTYPMERKVRIQKKQFEVEEQWKEAHEFAKDLIRGLPKISMEELIKYVPGYERKVYETVKKHHEEINYLGKDGIPKSTPVLCETNIQDVDAEAVVDSGVVVIVITRGLAERLPYE